MSIDTKFNKKTEMNQKGEYKVIFKGRLLPGYDVEQVVGNIAQLTKLPPEKIKNKFFNGKVVIIRRAHDKSHAQKLQHLFTEAGLEVVILKDVIEEDDQQDELPPQNYLFDKQKKILNSISDIQKQLPDLISDKQKLVSDFVTNKQKTVFIGVVICAILIFVAIVFWN